MAHNHTRDPFHRTRWLEKHARLRGAPIKQYPEHPTTTANREARKLVLFGTAKFERRVRLRETDTDPSDNPLEWLLAKEAVIEKLSLDNVSLA